MTLLTLPAAANRDWAGDGLQLLVVPQGKRLLATRKRLNERRGGQYKRRQVRFAEIDVNKAVLDLELRYISDQHAGQPPKPLESLILNKQVIAGSCARQWLRQLPQCLGKTFFIAPFRLHLAPARKSSIPSPTKPREAAA